MLLLPTKSITQITQKKKPQNVIWKYIFHMSEETPFRKSSNCIVTHNEIINNDSVYNTLLVIIMKVDVGPIDL